MQSSKFYILLFHNYFVLYSCSKKELRLFEILGESKMNNVIYVVGIKGRRDMNVEERNAARAKIEAVEGKSVWDSLRYKAKHHATQRAHWIQSTIGVPMVVEEVYPVTMKVL